MRMCCCHEGHHREFGHETYGHGCHGMQRHGNCHGHRTERTSCGCRHGEEVSGRDRVQALARQVSYMKERLEHLERELDELGASGQDAGCCEKD